MKEGVLQLVVWGLGSKGKRGRKEGSESPVVPCVCAHHTHVCFGKAPHSLAEMYDCSKASGSLYHHPGH